MILSGRKEVFMSQKRRQFTREFKLEAVRLVKHGQSVSRVAAELGIRPDMLRAWKRQVEGSNSPKEIFRGHVRVTSQEQELRRLRQELARVTEERDFLKKAAAYFAKEAVKYACIRLYRQQFAVVTCVERCKLVGPVSMRLSVALPAREPAKMRS
jgi:transposase